MTDTNTTCQQALSHFISTLLRNSEVAKISKEVKHQLTFLLANYVEYIHSEKIL